LAHRRQQQRLHRVRVGQVPVVLFRRGLPPHPATRIVGRRHRHPRAGRSPAPGRTRNSRRPEGATATGPWIPGTTGRPSQAGTSKTSTVCPVASRTPWCSSRHHPRIRCGSRPATTSHCGRAGWHVTV
jgi:hypothetical protein